MTELHLVFGNRARRALSPLMRLSEEATVLCTKDCITLQNADTNRLYNCTVIGVLRVDSSSFDQFCLARLCIAGIGLHVLYTLLAIAGDDDTITVNFDHQESIVRFKVENIATSGNVYADTPITDIPENYLGINEANREYEVLVGIPSEEFRRILRQMNNFWGHTVFVSITNARVEFSSVHEQVVLTKENGECIIGGVEEGEEANFQLSLHNIDSFLEASQLSKSVWLFHCHRSTDLPSTDLLNCPVPRLGNIKFYFNIIL